MRRIERGVRCAVAFDGLERDDLREVAYLSSAYIASSMCICVRTDFGGSVCQAAMKSILE
jgi:hypothetical protein